MKTPVAILATMPLLGSVMALPVNSTTTARLPSSRQSSVEGARLNVTSSEQSHHNKTLMVHHAISNTTLGSPENPLLGATGSARRFVPKALPQSTSSDAMHYQPVLDYDGDSCYNVPAIDAQGNIASGLKAAYTSNISGGCRDPKHLDNQNVYVRSRCNNGWCAYMYEHYFEKDVGLEHVSGVASGHRHEWENIVVVVKNGEGFPRLVAASAHDGYITHMPSERHPLRTRFQGAHPKIVYHKNGVGTHSFRFATIEDEIVENDKQRWVRGALVEWNAWPSTALRDRMVRAFVNTGTEPKISDVHFAKYLSKAIKHKIPHFNPWQEEGQ
ncbi:hypothetical protein E4U55_004170 [Claviceps digitariae]|nr:hypothetical protein E4U55_004170 [Claviceps digitariae]